MLKKYRMLALMAGISTGLVAGAQNVGVGTNTPLEKLHVAGNVKADTLKITTVKIPNNAASGKVLTSDSAGNASWQTAGTNTATTGSNGTVGFGSWGDCSMNGITGY